jgi:hypothetical protein
MPKGVAKRGRKERRPNLTPKEEREIVEHVLRDKSRQKSREKLAKEINRMLPQKEQASVIYLKKRISEIRSKKDSEGEPWTIGAKVDISHEALPSVLRCSKEAQILGLSFTIREAKCCARLSSLIKDTSALRLWAYTYANRELAYEILGKPFETADLDQILTTPPWELVTACLVGIVNPLEIGLYTFDENGSVTKRPISSTTPPIPISSGAVEIDLIFVHDQAKVAEIEFLYGPNIEESLKAISAECGYLLQYWCVADEQWKKRWEGAPSYQKFAKTWKPLLNVTPVETVGLSQEAVRVYTLWLGYLAKGPRMVPLENLNRVDLRKQVLDRLDTLLQLREWVKNHRLASGSEKLTTPPRRLISPLDRGEALFGLEPIDILRKVGYENGQLYPILL